MAAATDDDTRGEDREASGGGGRSEPKEEQDPTSGSAQSAGEDSEADDASGDTSGSSDAATDPDAHVDEPEDESSGNGESGNDEGEAPTSGDDGAGPERESEEKRRFLTGLSRQEEALEAARREEAETAAERQALEEKVAWRTRKRTEADRVVTAWRQQWEAFYGRLEQLEESCLAARSELEDELGDDVSMLERERQAADEEIEKLEQRVEEREHEVEAARDACDAAEKRARKVSARYDELIRRPSDVGSELKDLERLSARLARCEPGTREAARHATVDRMEMQVSDLRALLESERDGDGAGHDFEDSLYRCCRGLEEAQREAGQKREELAEIQSRHQAARDVLAQAVEERGARYAL